MDLSKEYVDRGKYKGVSWEDVLERDPSYVKWVTENWQHLKGELLESLESALDDVEWDSRRDAVDDDYYKWEHD